MIRVQMVVRHSQEKPIIMIPIQKKYTATT